MSDLRGPADSAEAGLTAPPLPKIPLARILKIRRELSDWVAPRFAHIQLNRGALDALVCEVAKHLPGVASITLHDSLDWLLAATQTETQLRAICWRLAGSFVTLRAGLPALPWRAPGAVEWCPAQVARVAPATPRGGQSRYTLDCRLLAGSPAGLLVPRTFSMNHLYLVSETIGFTKSKGERPLESPWQFVNMRLWVLLEPRLARDEQPGFFATRVTASLLDFNRTILDIRFRDGLTKCHQGYTHPCHRCHVGYEHCAAATHRLDYQPVTCPDCHKQRYRDPEDAGEQCIACFRRTLQHASYHR